MRRILPLKFLAHPTPRQLLLFAGAVSTVMLASVLVAQYGFGLYPCHLCLYQRYPYVVVMILGFFGAYGPFSPQMRRYVVMLCALLFLADSGIAFYHAGVELGWFPGPSGCTNNSPGTQTLEELRRQIMNAPLVTCDQAMVHIFGLSLAAWNAICAFLFSCAMLIGLKKGASHGA